MLDVPEFDRRPEHDSELSIFVQIIRASSREVRYGQLFGGWRVACDGHGIPRKRDRN